MQISAPITFAKGYIADPYWPEMEKRINIEKESGMRRTRSGDKAQKALRDYLNAKGLTIDDYEKICERAERPFYTVGDTGAEPGPLGVSEIVIPAHHLYGTFAQAADMASSSIRIARPEQLRSVLSVQDVFTGKTKGDGVFSRFVVVKAGAGQKLSNQRSLRENDFLGPFSAQLTVEFDEEALRPERVRDFVSFAGREIGVGASRKLGWGRFTTNWKSKAEAA